MLPLGEGLLDPFVSTTLVRNGLGDYPTHPRRLQISSKHLLILQISPSGALKRFRKFSLPKPFLHRK